ncbi:MAG: hypothetical protein ACOY42_13305, partial [Pseudomonadota bacterium]
VSPPPSPSCAWRPVQRDPSLPTRQGVSFTSARGVIFTLALTPGKILKGLPFSYAQLGYEKLDLLNKTDVKWLVECWGEPASHSTLHEMHHDLWREYEEKLVLEKKKQNEQFATEIRALLSPGSTAQQSRKQRTLSSRDERHPQRRSHAVIAIVIGIALVCALWWLAQ